MIEKILSSAVVPAIIAGFISMIGIIINNKNAKSAIHDERRYKLTQDLYFAFLDEIQLGMDSVHKERISEEEHILKEIKAEKYDIEDAVDILSSYYRLVNICRLLHQKMDNVRNALNKSAYLLDVRPHRALTKKYFLLNDTIKNTPYLNYLSYDFENHIDDIKYMYVSDSDSIAAYKFLERVQELENETAQALIDDLRKLCR